MINLYEFRLAVLEANRRNANDRKDKEEAGSIKNQIEDLEVAEERRIELEERKFLRFVGGRLVSNFIKFEIPKRKLFLRTLSASPNQADSINTISNGWIMSLREDDVSNDRGLTFSGLIMNQSKVITKFDRATIPEEDGSLRVTRLGDEFKINSILHSPHPVDIEDEIIGVVSSLDYDSKIGRLAIQQALVDAVINYELKV